MKKWIISSLVQFPVFIFTYSSFKIINKNKTVVSYIVFKATKGKSVDLLVNEAFTLQQEPALDPGIW